MGVGRFIHHIGTVLLLAAVGLLIAASISSPVINELSILKVDLGDNNPNGDAIYYGTFGWCVTGSDRFGCHGSQVGYDATKIMHKLDLTDFSDATSDTVEALTYVMVLHPVACGLAFIGFLMCLVPGTIMAFLASLVSALTFIVTVVVVVCDFVAFSLLKSDVNDDDNPSESKASYGTAIWCVLAAAIATLIATVVIFVTCCAGRRSSKKAERRYKDSEPGF